MIKFNYLRAKDFLALGEIEYFFEPDKIRLLLGRNEDSTTADDNGAGKSSVAEALRWALYGETVRQCLDKSLGVDHVIRRGQKKAVVIVEFEVNDVIYTVQRERNTTSQKLTVQWTTRYGKSEVDEAKGSAAQQIIEKALGIDVIQFSNLVYLDGSYPLLFAPSTDRVRKDILANLVDVAITARMEQEVKTQLGPIWNRLDQLDRLIGAEISFQAMRANQGAEAKQLGKELIQKCKILKEDITEETGKLIVLRQEVEHLREGAELAQKEHEEATKKAEKHVDTIYNNFWKACEEQTEVKTEFLIQELKDAQSQLDSYTREAVTCEKRIQEIRSLQSRGQCPTCGQPTGTAHTDECTSLAERVRGYKDEIQQVRDAITTLETQRRAKLDTAATTVQEWQTKWTMAKALLASVRQQQGTDIQELIAKFKDAQDAVDCQDAVVYKLKADYQTKETLVQQAKTVYSTALADIKNSCAKQNVLEKEKTELIIQTDKLEFWQVGFGPKGVPSLFIETVLPRISNRIQHFANILTGGDVTVKLKAYRETKSNTIQEAIQIEAINSKGASVYGANSAGERNRINLAVTLGLMDYFRAAKVFESNLLICDEIFDGLDSTGVEAALEALGAAHVNHVLVVSHHEHLKPMFPEVMYIVKKNGEAVLD